MSLPAKPPLSLLGFPLISGQVFLDDASSLDPSRPLSSRPSMVVQMLTPLVAGFLAFGLFLNSESQVSSLKALGETWLASQDLRPEHEVFCEVGKHQVVAVSRYMFSTQSEDFFRFRSSEPNFIQFHSIAAVHHFICHIKSNP